MKVQLTLELTDLWGKPEDLASLSDQQIVELLWEDMYEVFDTGAWKVIRD